MRRASFAIATIAVACAFPIADAELIWPPLSLATPRAIQLAVGPRHACARMADLTLRCWGDNENAGERTVGVRQVAVAKPEATGVLDVEVRDRQTCVRLSTGRQCWGEAQPEKPACVLDDSANVRCRTVDASAHVIAVRDAIQLAIGGFFTCALRRDRTVWCWGLNSGGELGDGTTTPHAFPHRVPGIDDAVELVARGDHACIRRSTGAVACWGSDEPVKQLRATPIPGIEHAVQIGIGNSYACALGDDGQVSCWGRPPALGDGTAVARDTPVRVRWEPWAPRSRGSSDVPAVSVAIANLTTCALREDGTVWCWGAGTGPEPRQVFGITDAVKLASHLGFTATDKDGVLYSWAPGEIPVILQRAISVASEGRFSCTLGLDRVATCGPDPRLSIRHVAQLDSSLDPICVVLDNRTVSCVSTSDWRDIPELHGTTKIAIGERGGCARLSSGEATCWNGAVSSTQPIDLVHVVDVFVGPRKACARTEAGRIWCWQPNQPSVEVPELFGARTIAMGRDHSCAVLAGDVVCKGSNESGELGDGTNIDRDAWVHVAW